MTRPMGDSCGKSRSLDVPADDEHPATQRNILLIQVAAIGESVGIGCEETLVCAHDGQAGCRFDAVIDGLFAVVENLETDFLRVAFHQLGVALGLAIIDVAPVLIFLRILAARVYAHRIFGELENVRTKERQTRFNRRLHRADRRHHRDHGKDANRDPQHGEGGAQLVRPD